MSEEKKIPFSHNEEYVDKQLRSINQMLEHRNYSLMNGIINASNEIYRSRRINRNSLRRALADPYNPNNVEILQQASMMLKATNGIYKRVLNYHASMYTHDFMILPLEVDKIKTPSKIQKAHAEAAQYIEKFNIKSRNRKRTRKKIKSSLYTITWNRKYGGRKIIKRNRH